MFFIHIGYRGILILHELSQCDSSNFLWVWLCILNGYRGITILCELSLNDSSISLYVWFCIHIGYLYHDSLWVVSMWFFNFALCFCIHIDYRGILLLREMSQCDSSNSLCVWFSHWLQGYRDSSWVVSKWFFNFALCDLVFSLYDFVFVSWFFMSCLYVILQLRFVCGFVFTLVTGGIMILQILYRQLSACYTNSQQNILKCRRGDETNIL